MLIEEEEGVEVKSSCQGRAIDEVKKKYANYVALEILLPSKNVVLHKDIAGIAPRKYYYFMKK